MIALLLKTGSLTLQVNRGCHATDTPGRVEARGQGRHHRQHDRPHDTDRVEMSQLLVSAGVRHGVHRTGINIQCMNPPEAECPETEAEYRPGYGEDAHLGEMLYEDVTAAGPECTAYTGDRRGIEKLGQQYANRVEQAHGQKGEGDADEQPVVVLNHTLVLQPLPDVGEPIVARTLEPSGLALLRPIPIQQCLHALAGRSIWQLDPHLQPDTLRTEVVGKRVKRLGLPAVRVPTVRILPQHGGPAER